jgi:hypothetical protein
MCDELDVLEEIRIKASLKKVVMKQKNATRHNKKVINWVFEIGDLVLRCNQKDRIQGILSPIRYARSRSTSKWGHEPIY